MVAEALSPTLYLFMPFVDLKTSATCSSCMVSPSKLNITPCTLAFEKVLLTSYSAFFGL